MSEIRKGVRARDIVSGIEGLVVARHDYLFGCTRYSLQPDGLDKDGKVKESLGVDEAQLEVLGDGINAKLANPFWGDPVMAAAPPRGGPRDDPHRVSRPIG